MRLLSWIIVPFDGSFVGSILYTDLKGGTSASCCLRLFLWYGAIQKGGNQEIYTEEAEKAFDNPSF